MSVTVRSLAPVVLFLATLMDGQALRVIYARNRAAKPGDNKQLPCHVEELKRILSALSEDYEPWNPILVDYTVKNNLPEVFLRARGYSSTQPLEFLVEARLARKGQYVRTDDLGPLVDDGRLRPCSQPSVHVFDGTHATTYDNHVAPDGKPVYCVSVDAKYAKQGYIQPLAFLSTRPLLEAIKRSIDSIESVDGNERTVACSLSHGATDNGTQIDRLSFKRPDGSYLLAELMPTNGYAVRLIEYGAGEFPAERIDDVQYESIDGRPFPIHAVRTEYLRGTHQLYRQRTLDVRSIVMAPEQISDKLFHVSIPHDAYVFDEDIGRTLRDQSAVQHRLEAMARELPARHSFSVRTMLVLVNAMLIVAILCVFLLRWRRDRR